MSVLRKIGSHEFLVDPHESCGISLEESLLRTLPKVDNGVAGSKKDILRALAPEDEYYPLLLHWEVLDKCNFSCPFCYIVGHSKSPLIRFPSIAPHLLQLIDAGVLFCVLTGGEVTLHPDFCNIYTLLKQRGVIVEVFTNGFQLDDNVIELFKEYPPYRIEVSLNTLSNQKLHNEYGALGDHPADTVLNNVLKLKKQGLAVVCKTFLNTLTEQDYDEVVRWCAINAIEHYSSSELTTAYDGTDITHFEIKEREYDDHCAYLKNGRDVCIPCGTRNWGCAMNAALEIFPCPAIRHKDCYFDLRSLGVHRSLKEMKSFIRRFQDVELKGNLAQTTKHRRCIAYAVAVRNAIGELIGFMQPGS